MTGISLRGVAGGGMVILGLVLLVLRFLGPPAEPEAVALPALRVEVLNGCGVAGAADRVASLLRRSGFGVERIGNADHFHYREDLVVARRVARERAEEVAQALGGVEVVEQQTPDHTVDITVIVGKPRPRFPVSP